ncbi:MAG: DUF4910 domain-containing protein [Clostridia bacterium]|nr:DUF4910 domain-containing protein [Clostridia bacterium]MBQ9924434.1 DUF4910 domain-containing protein [Clostridia bacterium]
MIRKYTQEILKHINGKRAFETVAEVSTFHRIQASTGFRAAAHHCQRKLERMGIPGAEVLSYPAREDVIFGTYPSFQEWDCKQAWLDLVTPYETRLADFDACAISVIQKSAPCDYRNQPLEVIMLDKGVKEEAYKNVDFEGKMVFVRDDINKVYSWVVEKRGAVGLITDFVLQDPHVRERHDQSDTLRYTSFWWEPGQKKAFGFVLSPREGDRFAALCAELAAKGQRPTVKAYVESAIYDGEIENVTAFLPGETDEEILLVGHLCHPRASANDNASGTACVMEAMRVLKDLTDSGKLPPLKRGVRMLLVPEFTGTYAYLDKIGDQAKKIRAAFNLDMVGGRQQGGYGPITITDLPMSTPSIVSDAAATILDEVKRQVTGMMPESYCPMWNSHMTEYSGGSDHLVLSDPQTNIPCLMLGQWPDKFYHTSSDTLDMVDPYILSRSASLAAAYAYSLSNLEPADIGEICNVGLGRAAAYMTELQTKMNRGTLDRKFYHGRLVRYLSWRLAGIDDFANWVECDQSELDAEKARLTSVAKAIVGFNPLTRPVKNIITKSQKEKCTTVVRRLKTVPVMINKLTRMYGGEEGAAISAFCAKYMPVLGHSVGTAVDYVLDGKRTSAEAARELAYEFGIYAPEAVEEYCKLLVRIGMAEEVK